MVAKKLKFNFYTICPACCGTGKTGLGNDNPSNPGEITVCQRCKDESEPFGAKIFNGLRHVYAGRFEEVEDE